ncbi:MAG: calcium/sodium antiporter [Bacteroidaceae bacterium]|nr:calcium/sodium antiporter [Bacteroidaceae bacterium]MBQ9176129.1 calcium/sodium antiporter [Bacteroidaceae bacterium]MBR1378707.1 calcium/sodium antiporter [Bacteroidaceae bacterium]
MTLDIIQFIVGLILVVKGADLLTDGGSSVAQRLRVPSLIIGLTIVAFGTSLPEFVVSTISATKGNSDMSLGNVVGSNIFNTLAVVGVTALFCPVVCRGALLRRDIPVNLVIAFLLPTLLFFVEPKTQLSRMEGIFLLVLFVSYLSFSIWQTLRKDRPEQGSTTSSKIMPVWKQILYIVLGLAMLIVGGDWFVDSASDIATRLGVSQSIIALTIVSIGTSLPELATSVIAARKGDTDMAMGNVVGSNIFNILLIVGTSAAITPICPEGISHIDLATMALSITLLAVLLLLSRRHIINRRKGCVLVVVAIAYYTCLVVMQ